MQITLKPSGFNSNMHSLNNTMTLRNYQRHKEAQKLYRQFARKSTNSLQTLKNQCANPIIAPITQNSRTYSFEEYDESLLQKSLDLENQRTTELLKNEPYKWLKLSKQWKSYLINDNLISIWVINHSKDAHSTPKAEIIKARPGPNTILATPLDHSTTNQSL